MLSTKRTARLLAGALREFSRNTGWMSDANCKDMDTNLFFPELGVRISDLVKQTCATCTVNEECAWYANESNSTDGMFAGMSPNEREAWRRTNKIKLGMSKEDWEASRKVKA